MKRAFIYQDEKTKRFWRINHSELELCVHYGKSGTIGKYEIKCFDSEEECNKKVAQLIKSKIKKGYKEVLNFDFNSVIYLDTADNGLHPKTSHPFFVNHFKESFYYDCGENAAPFGSDEGSDVLYMIQEELRGNKELNFTALPQYIVEDIWGFQYVPVNTLDETAVKVLEKRQKRDMEQSDIVTYAVAFSQIKTTGKVDLALKKKALNAIKRYAILTSRDGKLNEIQQKMHDDLLSFKG